MKKQPINKNVLQSKLVAMLAILLLCFTHLQVQAQWGFNSRRHRLGDAAKSGSWTNSDGTWGYCQTSSSELRITSYHGNAKSITTPEKINAMHVRGIGRRAFAGTKMEELCIAEGVWTIETDAFRGCQSLRRVTLPKSLMRSCVESSPFQYCRNLESLIIPLSLKDSFNIPRQAKVFYYENEPAEVEIPIVAKKSTKEKDGHDTDSRENTENVSVRRITFNPNRESNVGRYHYGLQGSGTMTPVSFNIGTTVKLPANTFTCSVRKSRAGDFYQEEYTFEGWATNKAGTVVFLDCSEVKLTGDTILYAKWSPPRHIRFNANGGEGSMTSIRFKKGETVKLPQNKYKRPGQRYRKPNEEFFYIFAGWSTSENGEVVYDDGSEATLEADCDVTLYAKWIEACEIHFMPNFSSFGFSGEERKPMRTPANESFALPTNTYDREGYEFAGWSLKPDGEVEFADGATVSFNHGTVKLYAQWKDLLNYHVVLHANNRIRYKGPHKMRIDSETKEILIAKGSEKALPTNEKVGFRCHSKDLLLHRYEGDLEFVGWMTNRSEIAENIGNNDTTRILRSVCNGIVSYADGATITPTNNMDLYADWRPKVVMRISDGGCLYEANLNDNETFELPADVTHIESYCKWRNAGRLKEFRVHPDNPKYSAKNGILYDKSGKIAVRLIAPLREVIIPDGVTEVSKQFIQCGTNGYDEDHHNASVVKVILPDSIVSIGDSAFYGCTNLMEIIIPKCVTNISSEAFALCESLTNVIIRSSTTRVDYSAFRRCDNIMAATIPFGSSSCPFSPNEKLTLTIDMGDGKSVVVRNSSATRYMSWPDLRKYAEFQTRRDDESYKFPANSLCSAHPALFKDFCAGASKVWCEQREAEIRENGERCDARFEYDDKLKILASVTIAFESPGVSVEALEAKYRKSAKGKFWKKQTTKGTVGDSKIAYEAKKFRRNASLEDSRGGAKVDLISMGDDEIEVLGEVYEAWGLMSLAVSQDVQTGKAASQGRLGSITIRSRKLDAALAERDRMGKAVKAKAEADAARKKEADALNF